MKQFLIRLICFATVFFAIDKIFIIVRNNAANGDWDSRLELTLEGKINKDLVIFGSSRGDCDVATWLFEKHLNLKSYNLSYGGSEIEFQTFVLKQLINNNQKPKIIIKLLDDSFELLNNPMNQFRIDRLLPLIKYPVIREELIRKKEKNRIMTNLFILHQISLSNFDIRKAAPQNDSIYVFGNLPTSKSIKTNFEWNYSADSIYDKSKENVKNLYYIKEFQRICLQNNIQLIFSIPPSFKYVNSQFVNRIKEIKNDKVYFHIYDELNPKYKSSEYFEDRVHLCRKGAELYTFELINFIKDNPQLSKKLNIF